MLDILCIGDAKIDIFLQIPDNDLNFSLDEQKNNLQIRYGRKINIDSYLKEIGGNACNTAVGISRLGKQVGICAEIGHDEFSNFIINTLQNEGLNTSFVVKDVSKPTSFSVCINYKKERTLLSEHTERTHNFNYNSTSANFIYLTSLGNIWQTTYQKTLDFIKQTKSTLAFNPGTLQLKDRGRLIMELISISDYLFVNKEEAEILLYERDVNLPKEDREIKKLLFGLKSLGAKNVIITDSDRGSFLSDDKENLYSLGILKTDVVDKTGAGDAYNAGFISAVLENKNLEDAMLWGTINASSVVEKIGAETGLLRKNELEEKISTLVGFKPEII